MHFVDDVDLVARRNGAVAHTLDQLAYVVDAGPAGGVHFQHVHVPVLGDRDTMLADAAGLAVGHALTVGADAIQRPRNDPGRGRFAHTTHAGQHEGVGQTAAFDGVAQRAHHGLLADQVGESRRAILAR